jgi:F420-dependent oxidoreductase-like protein
MVSPAWVDWLDFRQACHAVEELGFDSLWAPDLLTPAGSDWNDGPVLEGWSLLSSMAAVTRDIRIGCLVSSNTYRHPVVLAKIATTIDIISGGRLTFGIGAGWAEQEHLSYGIPFQPVGERIERMEEAVHLIKLLWESQEPVTFQGRYYSLDNAPFNPKPIQKPHPPILIAGGGEKRTLRAVAKYADAMNVYGNPEVVAHKFRVLEQHCRDVERDPREIEKTVLVMFVPQEQREAWDRYLEHLAATAPDILKRGQAEGMVGDMDDMREWVQQRVDIGVDHIILNLHTPYSLESLESFSREVMPEFR